MTNFQEQSINYEDYIDIIAIFGEVKKIIFSKSFKGGKITNLLGATKIDLTGADISGTVVIDVSQALGDLKIAVPSNWQVVTNISSIFSEVNMKRTNAGEMVDEKKVLVLTGTSFLANIKISGYQ